MWTRAELKNRAKMCLSRYYWAAFAVSLIFAILSGFGGSNANTQRVTSYLEQNATGSSRDDQSGLLIGELGGDGSLSGSTQSGLASGIELVPGLGDAYGPGAGNAGSMVASNLFYRLFAGAVVVIVIVSVVIGIFVQPLFEVGRPVLSGKPCDGAVGGCRKDLLGIFQWIFKDRGNPVPSGTDHRECCDPGQSVGISCDLV